jgi:hypothetical protein
LTLDRIEDFGSPCLKTKQINQDYQTRAVSEDQKQTDIESGSDSGYTQATPRFTHFAQTGRAESHRVLLSRHASHAVRTLVCLRDFGGAGPVSICNLQWAGEEITEEDRCGEVSRGDGPKTDSLLAPEC